MNTFLPVPSFEESARCLDDLRLANQRNEARTILRAIMLMDAGLARVLSPWGCHTAVRMWRNYSDALRAYYNAILAEWIRRGGNNQMDFLPVPPVYKLPPWLGDPAFHAAHRSALLRKDPDYYSQFEWTEPSDLEYIWPAA